MNNDTIISFGNCVQLTIIYLAMFIECSYRPTLFLSYIQLYTLGYTSRTFHQQVVLVSYQQVSVCLRWVSWAVIMSLSVSGGSREQSSPRHLHGRAVAVCGRHARLGATVSARHLRGTLHLRPAPHGQLTCASTGGCVDVKGEMMRVTSCHVTT